MSTEKTLDILDLFSLDTRELTVPEIAERLGQPVSSVYRHLRFLKEKGYVIEMRNGGYKLGFRFLHFANIVRADTALSEVALPLMRKLTKQTQETTILSVVSGHHAVCLEIVPSIWPIKVSSDQGKIMPLHVGASSKALLAYQPEELLDELYDNGLIKRYTPNTITDRTALLAHLADIRNNGYASSDEEIDIGVLTYGVPIRNSAYEVAASLSIAGLREKMLLYNKDELVGLIKEAVREIESYL